MDGENSLLRYVAPICAVPSAFISAEGVCSKPLRPVYCCAAIGRQSAVASAANVIRIRLIFHLLSS
jgi:hypothetical protein